jgi:hypothetical protein
MASDTIVSAATAAADPPRPFRLAGQCLRWATVTLAAAGVSLALFFGGAGAVFGPINDLTTAATLLLIVPGALATRRLARGRIGGWYSALTLLTVAGIAVAASGLVLLVARVITLDQSFTIGGIGMLPFLAWLGALGYAALRRGVVTPRVGWLSLGTLALSVVATAVSPLMPMNILVFVLGLPLLAIIGLWLWVFGRDLERT